MLPCRHAGASGVPRLVEVAMEEAREHPVPDRAGSKSGQVEIQPVRATYRDMLRSQTHGSGGGVDGEQAGLVYG